MGKIDANQGATMLNIYKKKLSSSACASVQLCIEAVDECIRYHQLFLSYGGHSIAYDLENPYISLVPKEGIELRVIYIIFY